MFLHVFLLFSFFLFTLFRGLITTHFFLSVFFIPSFREFLLSNRNFRDDFFLALVDLLLIFNYEDKFFFFFDHNHFFLFFFFYSKLCIIIFQILFKTNNIVEFIRFILNFYRFLIMNIVNIVEQSIIDYALIDSGKKYKLRVCNVIFVGRNSMTLSLGHHRPDYSMRMSPPVDVACAFI